MLSVRLPGVLLAALLAFGPSQVRAARDPKAAKAAVDAATTAMGHKDYETAAEQMERAYEFDPNPLWLANAGYARMLAGESDRAIELLSKALADPKLSGEGRNRAVERLSKASTARAHLMSARRALARSDFEAAARSFDDAHATVPIGEYALSAAFAWELAKRPAEALSRLEVALASGELSEADTTTATEASARIKANQTVRDPEPTVAPPQKPAAAAAPGSATSVLGWVLVGGGVATLGGGAAFFALGEGAASDLKEAQQRAEDGVVRDLSRARALSLASDVDTYRTVGIIGTVAGLALSTTGIVLLAVESGTDERQSVVQLGADLRPTRWMLTAGWRW
jgi:tetratricopeptide (TPR) repeat protein